MRGAASIGAALLALSPAFAQPTIDTGAALIESCTAYTADEALKDHPCKSFMVGFFEDHKKAEEDKQAALIQGREVDWSTPCFRMPDYASFRDLARLAIAHGQADLKLAGGTAKELFQGALVRNYPCAQPNYDETSPPSQSAPTTGSAGASSAPEPIPQPEDKNECSAWARFFWLC